MKPLNTWILAILFLTALPLAFATTVNEVASQLVCTCGCTMIVSDCNCGTADDMRALIQSKIDQGMDKGAILGSFVSQYGEKVLAAPTKSGFNLTAWILPFAALLVAGVVVTLVIRTWVRATQEAPTPELSSQAIDPQVRERLKRELDQFDA